MLTAKIWETLNIWIVCWKSAMNFKWCSFLSILPSPETVWENSDAYHMSSKICGTIRGCLSQSWFSCCLNGVLNNRKTPVISHHLWILFLLIVSISISQRTEEAIRNFLKVPARKIVKKYVIIIKALIIRYVHKKIVLFPGSAFLSSSVFL